MTDLLDFLNFGIKISLSLWLLVSPLFFIWWFFDTDRRERFTERHQSITLAIFIGSFLTLAVVLSRGIYELLVFIPADLGAYEEGEFVTIRSSITTGTALALSFFFLYVFIKFEEIREQNQRMFVIVEFQKRKDVLRYRSRQFLLERRDEVEAELESIYDRTHNRNPTTKEKREVEVLSDLLEKLEYQIRDVEDSDVPDEE